MKLCCCLAVCCLTLMTGCASTAITSDDAAAEAWPRISVEMRLLRVEEDFLEEFEVDSTVLVGETRQPPEQAYLVPVDDLTANLLVTATLAQQNSLSRSTPRVTLRPGQAQRIWLAPAITFVHDLGNEHLQVEAGVAFDLLAQLEGPADPEARLRILIVARFLPEGVQRGEELQWVQRRGAQGVAVYPERAVRVQANCAGGTTYLVAFPPPANDADDTRRTFLLFKPLVVNSPEEERALFPGLEGPPKTLGAH